MNGKHRGIENEIVRFSSTIRIDFSERPRSELSFAHLHTRGGDQPSGIVKVEYTEKLSQDAARKMREGMIKYERENGIDIFRRGLHRGHLGR